MTYRGIDRNRFAFLLTAGTEDFELKKFFSECRRQLILQGARVQNLPPTPRARIKALTADLPSTADPVVRSWFAKNITIVDVARPEDLVKAFKEVEENHGQLAHEEARVLARSCLVNLFSETPDEPMLRFLRSPIGGPAQNGAEPGVEAEPASEGNTGETYLQSLPLLLLALAGGDEVQGYLDGLPAGIASFALGLQAARRGRPEEVREALEGMSEDPHLRRRLEQFAQDQATKGPPQARISEGLKVHEVVPFEGSLEAASDWILGCCTNDRMNAVFVRLLAVVREGRVELFTDEQRRALFPDSGDAIAFSKPGYPNLPRRGEFGLWQVAEHESPGKTHFHLAKRRPVYEVRSLPFSSTDNDSVRDFLKEQARSQSLRSATFRQPALFLLEDGLVIGGPGELPDYARDEIFEAGLHSWTSLPVHRFEGRLLAMGPLPKENGVYECGSLATAVRKVFKSPAVVDKGFTKAQVQKLAEALDSFDPGVEGLRLQRVKGALNRLAQHHDAFDELIAEVVSRPEVAARVDLAVREAAAERLAEKQSIQADIERLRRERADLEQRFAKQKAEQQDQRDEVSKALKEAFEKARKRGLATFADLAVYQALSNPSPSVPEGTRSPPRLPAPSFRTLSPIQGDARAVFQAVGVANRRAAAFAALGGAALKAGIFVCVKGLAARNVVRAWVAGLGVNPGIFDAGVGLIDDDPVREALAHRPTYDAIAVLDANLSALDQYARPLFDLVVARVLHEGTPRQPALLLSLNAGLGSLPMPTNFEKVSVLIDIDSKEPVAGEAELEALSERAFSQDGGQAGGMWGPAATHLRSQLESLEPELRAMAISVWVAHGVSAR